MNNRQCALIDINMILDTRYGVLRRINEEAAVKIVTDPWYRNRDVDDFETISGGLIKNDEFKTLYEERAVETLVKSIITDCVYELGQDVKSSFVEMARLQFAQKIEFHINYWPYELLPSEIQIMERAVQRLIPLPGEVKLVNLDPKDVTPGLIDKEYDMFAYYNYEDWLKHHVDALYNHPIMDVTLLTPRISLSGIVPAPDHLVHDPFLAISALLSRHLQVVRVPISWACCNPAAYAKMGVPIS